LFRLGGHNISEYTCTLLRAPEGQEFITSDVPVVKGRDVGGGLMFICPLSSICCAVIYLSKDEKTKANIGTWSAYAPDLVNKIICEQAEQYLFYARHLSKEMIETFENNGNAPRIQRIHQGALRR